LGAAIIRKDSSATIRRLKIRQKVGEQKVRRKQSCGKRLQERAAPRKLGRWSSDAGVPTLAYQCEEKIRGKIQE
jgi:hypothetical protein